MSSSRFVRLTSALAVVAVSFIGAPAAVASADVSSPTAGSAGSAIVSEKQVSPFRVDLTVSSSSMGGDVRLTVLSPAGDAPRPTMYMLDGAGAGEDVSDWITKGGAEEFFAGRNVNAVFPAGGAASFYTNWLKKDPKIGRPQWETFLTQELPPLIDERFHGSGSNGVAGLSMGGQSAFTLSSRNPGLYRAIGSLSGCPVITGAKNEAFVKATAAMYGGNAEKMWGPAGGEYWRSHDPQFRLDALRGTTIYMESAQGKPGQADRHGDPDSEMPPQIVFGIASGVEIGADSCTREFAVKLTKAKVPFTLDLRRVGTHRWDYWKLGLGRMWKVLEPAL
ncbi:MAG: esterase family protein [Gordonia sp. (in: high G+C Gram-positive bacteria)]|jgi:S-formylglutathione hydrolase FrmB|nr:esterase family protein [Gordonia sp. (in: high G+C Gram-positive bacteria)]